MSYSYETIVDKAKNIKTNVEKNYKIGESTGWTYYICKEVIQRTKTVPKITFSGAGQSQGNDLSRQINQEHYLDMAKRLVKFVENNHKLPNYISYGKYKVRVSDYTYMFARILAYYDNKKKLPAYVNVNSKAFTKPTESSNEVFNYWVKKFGFTPKCIDDVCDYILKHFNYEFYFDDHKSNKQVIDSKAGNCTDLSQMLSNMAEALGYEWRCIHTKCRQSGTGHVYLKLRKGGEWFTRDVACIADESRYCVWCDVDNGGGNLISENPDWWKQNRNR